MTSQEPDVVEALPADKPKQFWERSCKCLGSSRLQYVGLDDDKWRPTRAVSHMKKWVTDFRNVLAKHAPERVLLTPIIVMAWPEEGDQLKFDSLDQFRDVLLAGANLRMKTEAFYPRQGDDFLSSFRRDLQHAGLMVTQNSAQSTPTEMPEPTFQSKEDQENYEQRLKFYGHPPFQWKEEDIAELFGYEPPAKQP